MKGFKVIFLAVAAFALVPISLLSQPYYNSPTEHVVIPEVIWAEASGGGTWVTNVQIAIRDSGGTNVWLYFSYAGGRQGPIMILEYVAQFEKYRYNNILEHMQSLDQTGFNYYGRTGALYITAVNPDRRLYAAARTYNGHYSKAIPGLNLWEPANTCSAERELVIQNLEQDNSYRSAVALFNTTASSLQVNFALVDEDANIIGSDWVEVIEGMRYLAFNPFVKAGVTGLTYNNCVLYMIGWNGDGAVMAIGATAHNISNDPASHIAYQFDY